MQKKKAVIISSCAAPGFIGRLMYGTHKQLKMTVQIIGGKIVGTLFTGSISKKSKPTLTDDVQKKIKTLAVKLV